MKGKLRKVLTLLLVLTLTLSMTVPVSARSRYENSNSGWSISSWLNNWWSSWWPFGNSDNSDKRDDSDDSDKDTESKDTNSSDSSSDSSENQNTGSDKSEDNTELQLVEDQSTVAEGTKLRASTYKAVARKALLASAQDGSTGTDIVDGKIVKYFPVTMYNYTTNIINSKTASLDKNAGTGIYFNDGNPNNVSSGSGGNYNYWTGNNKNGGGNHKAYVYGGLVQNELSNGAIVFNEADPGIFTTNDTTYNDQIYKSVYTNVGLPFVYTNSDGNKQYTFDAQTYGAYFEKTPASNTNLKFSTTAQSNAGDDTSTFTLTGSRNGFYPFNSTTSISQGDAVYHFGMSASIPFTMTRNGRLKEEDDTSAPIKFDFSGDDDVWVFVDGKLVLDLGGIHDSVSGSIDFANNTYSINATAYNKSGYTGPGCGDVSGKYTTKTANGTNAIVVGSLFNSSNSDGTSTTGLFNQTRESFAATSSHTLNIFYLERGKGASNCKISFNLPQQDYVSVTKSIDPNLYSADKQEKTDSMVSDALLRTLSNRAYTFVLYKADNTVAANQPYAIYNASNTYVGNGTTNARGEFSINYGQTARFTVADIGTYTDSDGNSQTAKYYVVEKNPGKAYGTADWTTDVSASGGSKSTDVTNEGTDYVSKAVSATGSDEANDYIHFTCTNKLLTPVADITEDRVVIDYGLADQIDVLANDSFTGTGSDAGTLTVSGLSTSENGSYGNEAEGAYGTATLKDGKVVYQLTKQMTGVDVFWYDTKLSTDASENTSMGKARLYIIPATSMYYEENFGPENGKLVSYDAGKWSDEGIASNTYQEEGRVGTTSDSPYGSDACYKDDSADSNGTSKHVVTSSAAAKFSYEFTGTGTSFFARTSSTTGYMRVVLYQKGIDNQYSKVNTWLRNTIYDTSDPENLATSIGQNPVLYNIPVFTQEGLEYGTYKVEVTVAKSSEKNKFGKDFYLDGVRVINPLDSSDTNCQVAENAYNTDGESDMTSVTLRTKLLDDNTTIDENGDLSWNDASNGFVVFTDIDGNIKTASRYQSIGPKEEVYLYKPSEGNGQSVQFSLKDWDPNTNKLFLGIKAPTGSAKVNINGNEIELKNSVDCYYDITNMYNTASDDKSVTTFTITASQGLVSLTNIKVTGHPNFTIVNARKDVEAGDDGDDTSGDGEVETSTENEEDSPDSEQSEVDNS